ncbi:MAG: hypothetical protein NTV63_01805 [Candidatus Woesearchaeota archaeon]|nr:hypothetical protein [Candidatus Woesearchaeota archaeon]
MKAEFTETETEGIIDFFGIKTDVRELDAKLPSDAKAYLTKEKRFREYILDSPEAREIACYPSIVGSSLEQMTEKLAKSAYALLSEEGEIGRNILFCHILRASVGYNLHEIMKTECNISEAMIRTQYVLPSYRAHDSDEKEIRIIYEKMDGVKELSGKRATLVIQDTVASGKTIDIALKKILESADESHLKIDKLVLYGFIAKNGLLHIYDSLRGTGIRMTALAIGNITPISTNGYDMPLYGPDEFEYRKSGIIRLMGGTCSRESLESYLPAFIPGADQPGDWSARLSKLYNGNSFEKSEITSHLKNSEEYIIRLETLLKKEFPKLYEKFRGRISEELENLRNLKPMYIDAEAFKENHESPRKYI